MNDPQPDKVHPVDVFVGERLKQLRNKLKLSQTKLGEMVGISFQQIQKYEKGQNRIPASKLFEFSEVLNAPITYFYDGIDIDDDQLDITIDVSRIKFSRTTPLKILLLENDPSDAIRTRKAIEQSKQKTEVYILHDGIKAKQFLQNKKGMNRFGRPDIILSEMKLGKIDGIELLKDLRRDKDLKDIPYIFLTSSISGVDMIKCYKFGATSFVGKSIDDKEFQGNIEKIVEYWSSVVILPSM
mgnify:FL=1